MEYLNEIRRHSDILMKLEQDRDSWLNVWKNISEYILPRRGSFDNKPNDGSQDNLKIWDSTATVAMERLASGIHGGLTSPSRKWFRLSLTDESLLERQAVRRWLDSTEKIMYNAFAHSNFYDAIHEADLELVAFGTTCLLEEMGSNNKIIFKVVPAGQYCLAPGLDGRIDILYRKFWMQLRQIVQEFGIKNLPVSYVDRLERYPYDWFSIVHYVGPNPKFNPNKPNSAEKAFDSIYFLYEGHEEKPLRRGGYSELPFFAPRWSINGNEVYGRGPGSVVLPDVKMLQEMVKTFLKAVHKLVDPPMSVPAGTKGRLNMTPGGITFYNGTNPEIIRPLYAMNFDTSSVYNSITVLREQIKTSLFNDLFIMDAFGNRDRVTAQEVAARREDKMLLLGPVIERLGHELLDPLLSRTLSLLMRQQLLPSPPPELENAVISVTYVSTLAQAQRAVGTSSIMQLVSFVSQIMQIQPDVVDAIDWDEVLKQYADMIGINVSMIRGEDLIAQMREQKAQAVQQQQDMQEMQSIMQSATALSAIPMDKQTAFSEVMNEISESEE